MLLNGLMCLGLSVAQRLYDQFESENSVLRKPVQGRLWITTSAQDHFPALATKEEDQYVVQLI